MVAFNKTKGTVVAANVAAADTPASRSKGLLGRESMAPGEGLWIVQFAAARFVPCPTIHTFFMKFSIDVLFLDADLAVRKVIEDMRPGRLSPWVPSASSILELPAGTLKGSVSVGDRLEMRPA